MSRAFKVGLTFGGAIMTFGVAGFVRHRTETDPASSLKFLIGALVAHDALFAWAVAAVGALLVRVVPARVRPVVMGALATSVVLTLVVLPALTGNGRLANNPSILPRDYTAGLLTALAVVWGAAALLALRALRRPPTAIDLPQPPQLPPHRAGW